MRTSLYIWIFPLEIMYLCMYVSKAELIFTSAGFGHSYSKYGAPGPPQSSPYCTELSYPRGQERQRTISLSCYGFLPLTDLKVSLRLRV